jgi:hypothetical protein
MGRDLVTRFDGTVDLVAVVDAETVTTETDILCDGGSTGS